MIKKIFIVFIISLLLGLSFTNIIEANNVDFISDSEFKTDFDYISINSYQQSKILIIENIEDGFGFKIFIKNIGDDIVQNCILKTEIIEGSSFVFFRKNINIPNLNPGETWQVNMKPFGFSFGMLSPFSMITFSFEGDDIITYEWGIITNIVGPYTNILGNYFNSPFSSEGYTLFAPMLYDTTYLINNEGLRVHAWGSWHKPGFSAYLAPDGYLYRSIVTGHSQRFDYYGGGFEKVDWEGNVVWHWEHCSEEYRAHHDIEVMPDGNVLVIAWELKSQNDALEAGRDPARLNEDGVWPDYILEVQQTGDSTRRTGSEIVDIATIDGGAVRPAVEIDIQAGGLETVARRPIATPDFHTLHPLQCRRGIRVSSDHALILSQRKLAFNRHRSRNRRFHGQLTNHGCGRPG